jgi:hypothetical protein
MSFARRTVRLVTRVALVSLLGGAGVAGWQASSASAATVAEPGRAMWVWDTSTPEATVRFAVAHGVTQLYAAVPLRVDTSPQLAQLTRLVTSARAVGVRVDALGGDPGWVDDPAWVARTWLQPALATGLFAGVHVDVEPYSTTAWRTSRDRVVKRYLSMYDALRTSAGATPVEADIPFWFDEVPSGRTTLDREVLRRVDGVTVMAYRNRATGDDGTIALSANEVAAGAALGKPVRIGQETNDLGSDPTETKQTFHGWSSEAMEAQLGLVTAAYAGSRGFAGLAIHDSVGWSAITG